jgi:exosortase B
MPLPAILRRCPWGLLFAAVVLVGPTLHSLAHGVWLEERQSHGPVMALVACWLFWHRLTQPGIEVSGSPARAVGWGCVLVGLALYAVGRSQAFPTIEVMALPSLSVGVSLLVGGWPFFKHLAFCHFFLLFLVPVPGQLADALTNPLKIAVSHVTEGILSLAGYTVARSGVILYLPPYKLMVADACSGLNSLFMLEAFGLLYLNVVKHTSLVRNAVLSIMIVPISFMANVIRVLMLATVTLRWGDEAASGFFHSFSGLVLFLPALVLTALLDAVLRRWVPPRQAVEPSTRAVSGVLPLSIGLQLSVLAAAMAGAAASFALRPLAVPFRAGGPGLAQAIPNQFGNWHAVDGPAQVNPAVSEPGQRSQDQPYDEVVMRTYQNTDGMQVMLTVAYAHSLQQDVKIHRPEVCYSSQGFQVTKVMPITLPSEVSKTLKPFDARTMTAIRGPRREALVYWVRTGGIHAESALESRIHILSEGIKGHVLDGVLVRVSTLMAPGQKELDVRPALIQFLRQLREAGLQRNDVVLELLW